MLHTTVIHKDYYSKKWSAKTYIKLDVPTRELKVSTFKSLNGLLYSSCQAVKIESKSNTGFSGESFLMYGDFSKKIMSFPEIKKVTDKIIGEAHDRALLIIDQFVKEANEFYANELLEG
jgi:hypothetical protein